MMKLLFLIKYSYRNLWRQPKRTAIMMVGLAFATGYMIFDLNFANSGSREIIKELLNQYFGRAQITHRKYYEKNDTKKFDPYKVINLDDPELHKLKKVTPRTTIPIFISGSKKTLGSLLVGINPEMEGQLNKLPTVISQGRFLKSDDIKPVILGERLARRLGVTVSDEVAVIGSAMDGSIANDLFTVVGLANFGGGDLEETIAFTNLTSAQEFASLAPNQAHLLVDFNTDSRRLPKLKNFRTVSWKKTLPEISVSIRFIDHFTWIVSLIIVLVVSLGMSNTLMITFLEREKEFETLTIIGAKSSWLTLGLVFEVIIMGTISILLGVGLGHIVTRYFYFTPINIEWFTGGKPIMMGGMTIVPLVRLYPVAKYYWQAPLFIYTFIFFALIYPLHRVYKRSRSC